MSYIGLHQHTIYSFLDGYCKIPNLVRRSKELGWNATAITDHNHIGGCYPFKQECEKQEIKPLLGLEGYYTPSISEMMKPVAQRNAEAEERAIALGFYTREDIDKMKREQLKVVHNKYGYDMNDFHILFIAKSQKGWHNLIKIQSESARLCTFNGRYHCDMDLLEKYSEDVINTTACIGSFPAQQIELGNYDIAEEHVKNMKQIFGDNYYLEIQPLNVKLQRRVNVKYMEWSRKYDIPMIATNDSHWVLRDDAADHDVLLCIGIGKSVADPARMHYMPEFWVRSEEEMEIAFEKQVNEAINRGEIKEEDLDDYVTFYKKALANTQFLADSVDSDIRLGAPKPMFPVVKIPNGKTPESVLTHMAYSGLYKHLKKNPSLDKFKYVARLKEELDVINPKGFASYMLTVSEYINWCDENHIPTGPGRGSAAGSLVLFCIGITKNIDPIADKLLFGRFLTKDRKDLPDIDCDVSNLHRENVIKHLEDYYGRINVAHVGTYGTLKVKSACKDVARVLDVPFADSLKISKELDSIDDDPNLSFKMIDNWETSEEPGDYEKWKRFKKLEEANQRVFSYARKFEGIPRQLGVHASAVLVTPEPVDDWVPLFYKDGTAITLYTGPQVEACNFVKLDVLGLKTLDVIQLALKYIDPDLALDDFYDKVNRDDPKIFKMIQKKQTDGMFQIESDMMKSLVNKIQPTAFHDLSALIAIGRPGPLSAKADDIYANGKHGKSNAPCPLRGCENIFDETYRAIIYQEQLMHVSKQIAGFDDTQADSITRKTTAKKKKEMMPLMLRCHIYGKKNVEGPPGWEDDMHAPWYDPKGKYGGEIDGAIAKGYTEKEVLDYFKSIEAFSSYAFNKSHCDSYSYIAVLTGWLKVYYPTEFMAALLSIFNSDEEKRKRYINVCEQQLKIKFRVPDINMSNEDFTPNGKEILYGFGGVKGCGAASIPGIIEEREKNGPYKSLADVNERLPKNIFKKNVAEALIKCGAFDFEDENRYALLNQFMDLRKDKKSTRYNEDEFNDAVIIDMEESTLGIAITKKPWWSIVKENEKVENEPAILISRHEKTDKRGQLMGFYTLSVHDCKIEAIVFASTYARCCGIMESTYFMISGKKDSKGKLLVSKAIPA